MVVKKYIGSLVLIIASIFLLRTILNYSTQIQSAISLLDWWTLGFSLAFYLGYYYLRAFSWNLILETLGHKLALSEGLFSWFVGESTRYIPGGVWPFASRYYITSKRGVTKRIIILSMLLEICLLLPITFILSLPSLITLGEHIHFNLLSVGILILGIIIALIGILWSNKLDKVLGQVQHLNPKIILTAPFWGAVVLQIAAWFCFAAANYVLIASFAYQLTPIQILSLSILSWLIGYVSLVTPTGLGVREGAMIVLLTPSIGAGQASILAVLSRLILIITEGLNVSFWLYLFQKSKVENFLKKTLSHWDLLLSLIAVATYAYIFSDLSILRHDAFASNYDLANMTQTVWNTLHGRPFQLSGAENTISRFSIHADLILVIISPLYWIWERTRTLLIIQSVALALGGIPVYFLSKKILNNKFANLSLVLVYLLNPAMEWTNIYDFHGVALAIPLLLATFYFAYTKKWFWFWVFAVLSMTTKEEVPLLVANIGLMVALFYKSKKVGFSAAFVGVAWFLIMTFAVIPYFSANGQHWGIEGLYNTPREKLSQSQNPLQLFDNFEGYFLDPAAFDYYLNLLKPFSFLPLLGLPWLLLSWPEFVINLLSSNALQINLQLHYDSGITPFLVIATIFGLHYLVRVTQLFSFLKSYHAKFIPIFSLILLVIAFRVNYHYSPLPTTPSCWCLSYQVTDEDRQFAQVLATIPPNASVTASGEVRPHLVNRENAFTLPGSAETADYVAMITQNRIVGNYSPKEFENSLLKDPQFLKTHQLVYHSEHFYLFKRLVPTH